MLVITQLHVRATHTQPHARGIASMVVLQTSGRPRMWLWSSPPPPPPPAHCAESPDGKVRLAFPGGAFRGRALICFLRTAPREPPGRAPCRPVRAVHPRPWAAGRPGPRVFTSVASAQALARRLAWSHLRPRVRLLRWVPVRAIFLPLLESVPVNHIFSRSHLFRMGSQDWRYEFHAGLSRDF